MCLIYVRRCMHVNLLYLRLYCAFLPLYALAMERSCRRLTSVRLSVRNVGEH